MSALTGGDKLDAVETTWYIHALNGHKVYKHNLHAKNIEH
jgi:hypothetical protein